MAINIKAFLQPPVMNETKEVVISKRFKREDGTPEPFVIRAIDQETNDKLTKKATIRDRVNGRTVEKLDNIKYSRELIAACVVSPDFSLKEICDYYKTNNPLEVPGRMLSAGEYGRLVKKIMKLNDIPANDEDIAKLEDEIKNS